MTAQNQPLVRIVGKKQYDAIGEAFSSLCKVAGVRDRGFYLLRHTGINLVKKISNSEMADLYSQHAPVTVSQKFYENADWKELRKVLRRLRRKLQPLFDAAISEKDQAIEAESADSSVLNCPGTQPDRAAVTGE